MPLTGPLWALSTAGPFPLCQQQSPFPPKRHRTFPQISTREFLGESAGRPRRSPPPAGVRAGDVGVGAS